MYGIVEKKVRPVEDVNITVWPLGSIQRINVPGNPGNIREFQKDWNLKGHAKGGGGSGE